MRAAALRNALPTTVLAVGVRRHSRDVESAAYFCCLEALQNATKHAEGASVAVIELSESDALRLEVRDDGAGFDPTLAVAGAGFVSMRDRMAAVRGELVIISSPATGRGSWRRSRSATRSPEVRARGRPHVNRQGRAYVNG